MSNPGTAPGPLWEPPRTYTPGPAPSHNDWNALTQQVARLSRMTGTGLFTSAGYWPDAEDGGKPGSAPVFIQVTEALGPGSLLTPSEAKGRLFRRDLPKKPLVDTRQSVNVINFSSSIFAPPGGTVIAELDPADNVTYIAIGSSC